ncbi:putative inner membrane transporter YhbE [Caloramator mitchellensis]|uniref:Putative inner membrane transporter YhbE n=1 Tax=Caloramator mitchellensis TaxID=908809 RepID=A0A0R3JTF6_CALMK|nr:DMT family transporter [Caloramator mitchellensis]KRQ86760.1 putative inner membrane transporter YhbE [Caloramator mitchellensis]
MRAKTIYGLMVMSALFWAGAFIAAKLSAPYITPFTLTFLRFSIATVILYFVLKYHFKTDLVITKKDIPSFLFTGIVGMFGYHVLFFIAMKHTTAINSSLIAASNPILTTIFSIIILKDSPSYKRILGILLSFTGVVLTITNGNIGNLFSLKFNLGDIIMLLAVLMWGIYSVFSKRIMPKYNPFLITFYSFLICTIFIIPLVILENPFGYFKDVPFFSIAAVIYMAIFPTVIGYLVQQISIKEIGPSKTSIFVNLVPIFSIILSILILNETISWVKLSFALLIISGVYITQIN